MLYERRRDDRRRERGGILQDHDLAVGREPRGQRLHRTINHGHIPAAVEAHYSAIPLIFITADRPARYRGTGAPQAIEQQEIFSVYAHGSVQHANIEFDEPLIDQPIERMEMPMRPARPSFAGLSGFASSAGPAV